MKKIAFITLFLICSKLIYGQTTTVYTPTGQSFTGSISADISSEEKVYWDSVYQAFIDDRVWNANIIDSCSYTYNCHAYAWHVSDGGSKVCIAGGNLGKYYSGSSPSYILTTATDSLEKVTYYPEDHSAITTNDPDWVVSKWGDTGPLVKHYIADCPYEVSGVYYYKVKLNGPNTVARGAAVKDTTLYISGATYKWTGNSYVCGSGNYVGAVTGTKASPALANGRIRVAITSPYSNTTIKAAKYFYVTNPSTSPYISGSRLVCSSGTAFTLNNPPSGNTITWTSSSNLSTANSSANPCTFTASSSACSSGWVRATVSSGCRDTSITYTVWAGKPAVSPSGPDVGYVGNSYLFYANEGTYSAPTSYSWTLSPKLDNSVYSYGSYVDISFYTARTSGYQVVVRATNTCGTGEYGVTRIAVYDEEGKGTSNETTSPGSDFIVYPNPASDDITIAKSESSESESKSDNSKSDKEEVSEYSIKIIDLTGVVCYTGMGSGDTYTFPVSNLKNGSYVVLINDGVKDSKIPIVISR